jgi:DNA mismatch repair ATPase MutS
LNPGYVFPEFISDGQDEDRSILTSIGLGHPLIPANRKICNDFTLHKSGETYIITGSNMSGKSSFLKAVGVNLCLAYAGGPVNAESFHTDLFRVFTCIKINDSIVDGFSFFYAEVRRLKALLDELQENHPFPLLFLIDEIFKGTNNRERLVGSRSYIRSLIGRKGAGLIATHDLDLIKLADRFPDIINSHFREEVIDGKMVFDYKLRPGPCPTTNALKIMQMEGLPVDSIDSNG